MSIIINKLPTVLQEYIFDFIYENKKQIREKYYIVLIQLLLNPFKSFKNIHIDNINIIFCDIYNKFNYNSMQLFNIILKIIKSFPCYKIIMKNWLFITCKNIKLSCYSPDSKLINYKSNLSFIEYLYLYDIFSGSLHVYFPTQEIIIPYHTIKKFINNINK